MPHIRRATFKDSDRDPLKWIKLVWVTSTSNTMQLGLDIVRIIVVWTATQCLREARPHLSERHSARPLFLKKRKRYPSLSLLWAIYV